jgi:hypothetical protein
VPGVLEAEAGTELEKKMIWIRIDAPNWTRAGRPVIAVALDYGGIIRACPPLVAKFRNQSWYTLKRWLESVVTRLKNRAAAGLCTCCNRSFQNLRKHMEIKHPEQVKAAGRDV